MQEDNQALLERARMLQQIECKQQLHAIGALLQERDLDNEQKM